ncbi:MAG: ferredoxin [Bacilli bacterium]|nr:ferredoxin [Bacilli bacterium]
MKVKINEDSCIGCGACQSICENVFEINDEGLSSVKVEEVSEDDVQSVRDAADSCPTSAIEIEEEKD